MRLTIPAILLGVALSACTVQPAPAPLFQKVLLVRADGSTVAVTDKELSPFQQLLRSHLPVPPPKSILAVEIDQPDGAGTAGRYLAVLRSASAAELRYYEQNDHSPRLDRHYFRVLSADEVRQLDAFLKDHPPAQMAALTPVGATAATEPATAPATAPTPATLPSDAADPVAEDPPATSVRVTDVQPKDTRTILLESPAKDSPADQLIALLDHFRQTGTMSCNYFQPFPPAARMLFSDPRRQVLQVWIKGDDIRAAIVPVTADVTAEPEPQWLAYQNNQWAASQPPPDPDPAATAPATQPVDPTPPAPAPNSAVLPPDIGVVPRLPAIPPRAVPVLKVPPMENPGMLPEAECWWTQAGPNYTTVWHYVPLSEFAGTTLGFVVPTFRFDVDHMAIDPAHQTLYLIHEGQLFALPIPPRAWRP